MNQKILLRSRYKEILKTLPHSILTQRANSATNDLLKDLPENQLIMSYMALPGEIDLIALNTLLAQNNCLVLPYVNAKTKMIEPYLINSLTTLRRSSYGILEPDPEVNSLIDVNNLAVILIPGLAFDCDGYRLGRGAGYYDKFLSQISETTITYGIAHDEQRHPVLPREDHDIPMKKVLFF